MVNTKLMLIWIVMIFFFLGIYFNSLTQNLGSILGHKHKKKKCVPNWSIVFTHNLVLISVSYENYVGFTKCQLTNSHKFSKFFMDHFLLRGNVKFGVVHILPEIHTKPV